MSRGFVFFLIVALIAGVTMWGYIGRDGQDSVLEFLRLKKRPGSEQARLADVSLGGVTVRADLASDPASRERGLGGRSGVGELEGMLFLFDQAGSYGFWMKDMQFPIDIIWINDGKVVDIAADVQPSTALAPPLFTPRSPANRVLEVESGFAAKHGIRIGTPVSIRFDGFR